jgi:hypothetical protein
MYACDMTRYFSCFEEEKEFYKKKRITIPPIQTPVFGYWWDQLDRLMQRVDPDIKPFIQTVNSLPFAYSKGMSCSGSFSDHHVLKDQKAEYTLCVGGHNMRFGIRLSEPQGYAVLRVNQQAKQCQEFLNLLARVPHSALTAHTQGDRHEIIDTDRTPHAQTVYYQVFVPPTLQVKYPEDTTYMTKLWQSLTRDITHTFL